MLFNSYEFIFIFLPVVLAGFFLTSSHNKNFALLFLLAGSLTFYGTLDFKFLPLLICSVLVNYFVAGKLIPSRKLWLIAGITFNFGLLFFFKCINLLPLGISFFTFTQTAYIIEVYKSVNNKSSSLLEYSDYVAFFPCITSGPITNYKDIKPQLSNIYKPDYDNLAKGLTLFFLGLFKKVYIADSLAPIVKSMFTEPEALSFFEAWTAALSYSFQLYFDFSGYSDMAVALGLMLNINLPVNFDSPYKSTSIIDFWRRWHISLGRWIRDYIYIPLGGSREGEFKKIRNVILAMLFTGIWHGMGLTFILWGAVHGIMLAINHQWRRLNIKLPVVIAWPLTFISVIFCWVIFRAESLDEALKMFSAMTNLNNIVVPVSLSKYLGFLKQYGITFGELGGDKKLLAVLLPVVLLCPNSNYIMQKFRANIFWLVIVLVLAVASFMNFSGITDFLYFQF
ncbi:MAG: MBOAT family protein [Synergistaceae bacterium]|nr:MBOAT family protein [Synergistaceae bacterium]